MVPTEALPPGVLFTDQLTPVFEVPVTTAEKGKDCVVPTKTVEGVTSRVTPETKLTVAEALALDSATLIAFIFTAKAETVPPPLVALFPL